MKKMTTALALLFSTITLASQCEQLSNQTNGEMLVYLKCYHDESVANHDKAFSEFVDGLDPASIQQFAAEEKTWADKKDAKCATLIKKPDSATFIEQYYVMRCHIERNDARARYLRTGSES